MSRDARVIVTLSGIVGAGKSSVARSVVDLLRSAGHPVAYVRFQDFAGLGRRRRNEPGSVAPAGGAPEAAAQRGAGYRRRRLSPVAAAGYALRTAVFRLRLATWPANTVLVFDRYFYDSLAHFELVPHGRAQRFLMRMIPVPSVAALLMVDEATARIRRPRYAEAYIKGVLAGYGELRDRLPGALLVRTDG